MTTRDAVLLMMTLAVRSALVLAVALLICRMMRRQSAAVRHAVWTAAVVGCFALPLATIQLASLGPALESMPDNSIVRALLSPSAGSAPFSADVTTSIATSSAPEANADSVLLPVSLAVLWTAGCLLVLLRLAGDIWRANRLAGAAKGGHRIAEIHRSAAGSAVPVIRFAGIDAPVTAGIFRPVILLPLAVPEERQLDLAAIIAHEAAHVRRRDILILMAARILCALYWFNPLTWYCAKRLRAEAERACDDLGLESGISRVDYANLLVRIARASGRIPRGALVPMAADAEDLERRVKAVLSSRTARHRCSRRMSFAVAACAGIMTAAAAVQARPIESVMTPRTLVARADVVPIAAVAGFETKKRVVCADSVELEKILRAAADRKPLHAEDYVAIRAKWALAQWKDDELVRPLIEKLRSGNARDAEYAAWALGYDQSKTAVPQLVAVLSHEEWRVRASAAASLALLKDRRAVDGMVRALTDSAWQVRLEAVKFLGSLGDAAFIDRIRAARGDSHVAVRLEAESVLAERQDR